MSSVAKLSSEDFTISDVFTISSAAGREIPPLMSREAMLHASAESILARLPVPIPSESTT